MKSIILMFFLFSILLINMSQYETKAVSKRELANTVDLKNILDDQLKNIGELRENYRRTPKKSLKFNLTPKASEMLARKLQKKGNKL